MFSMFKYINKPSHIQHRINQGAKQIIVKLPLFHISKKQDKKYVKQKEEHKSKT